MAGEKLTTQVDLPPPDRRETVGEKAKRLKKSSNENAPSEEAIEVATLVYKKITGRVFPDQQEWFSNLPKEYRARHPRQPRLTSDELMRIAIDHLRNCADIDSVIAEYRS